MQTLRARGCWAARSMAATRAYASCSNTMTRCFLHSWQRKTGYGRLSHTHGGGSRRWSIFRWMAAFARWRGIEGATPLWLGQASSVSSPPWDHWLLIRRSIADPELAAVAGLRWTIEECFQSAKGETGLDHCEARSWHAVYVGARLSGRIRRAFERSANRRCFWQSEQKESIRRRMTRARTLVAISVQELRRLVVLESVSKV